LIILAGLAVCYFANCQEIEMEVDATLEDGTFDAQEFPLHHFVSEGDIEAVEDQIRDGEDLNVQNIHGWTPLMFAVEKGREEIFNMLVDAGADLNLQENDGWTALMFAGFHGDAFMVDKVLEAGGDALITNNFGYAAHTITHNREHYDIASRIASAGVVQAIARDDVNACVALIKEGADVHAHNENGWTALTLAVTQDKLEAVKFLVVDMHANVDWLENDGWSPLMFAANNNYFEIAELLVNNGADIGQMASNGADAVTLARDHGFLGLLDLLLNNSQQSLANLDEQEQESQEEVSESAITSTATPAEEKHEDTATTNERKAEEKKTGFFNW